MATVKKCAPCARAWARWLDYRLAPPPIQLITIGGRLRDVQDGQESRFRQWRDTIRFQQDLIDRLCAEGHHAEDDGRERRPERKPVVTLDVEV